MTASQTQTPRVAWWRLTLFALAVTCRWRDDAQRRDAHRLADAIGTPRGDTLLTIAEADAFVAPLTPPGLDALVEVIDLRAGQRAGGVLLPRRAAELALGELRAWQRVRRALAGHARLRS